MKKIIIKICLWIANKMVGVPISPYFGAINNIDNFSWDYLRYEAQLYPQKTVQEFTTEAMKYKKCMESRGKNGGLCVIQDGECHDASDKEFEEIAEELKHL